LKIGILEHNAEPSYLWGIFAPFFTNPYISLAGSSLFVGGIAFLASHINTEHVLIRNKSFLVPSVILLMFSCQPSFISMSAEYVALFLFLSIIGILFASYQGEHPQSVAFRCSFMLTLGSLFVPVSLIYLPVLWIAFIIIRSFNIKSLLASISGVIIIYFPVFSYYLFIGNLDAFYLPLQSLIHNMFELPFAGYNTKNWILLSGVILLLAVIIGDDYINRHKDKIKVRSYLSLLLFLTVTSFLLFLFSNTGSYLHLFITMLCGGFLISHFFALVEKVTSVLLFLIVLIFYLFIIFLPFLLL
jgi:hypothetical protein